MNYSLFLQIIPVLSVATSYCMADCFSHKTGSVFIPKFSLSKLWYVIMLSIDNVNFSILIHVFQIINSCYFIS